MDLVFHFYLMTLYLTSAGFWAKWNYIDQLEESIHTGTVLQDHLKLTKSNYQNIRTAELWCERIKPLIGNSYHSWISTITLFDLYIRGQKFNPLKKYTFPKSRDSGYPLWCSRAVDDYLDWLRRSFHSESTVRSYKYTVYNFCDFILSRKLDSFQNLTRNLINDFMRKDFHSTVNGISGRNTVLRQFITHAIILILLRSFSLHFALLFSAILSFMIILK